MKHYELHFYKNEPSIVEEAWTFKQAQKVGEEIVKALGDDEMNDYCLLQIHERTIWQYLRNRMSILFRSRTIHEYEVYRYSRLRGCWVID